MVKMLRRMYKRNRTECGKKMDNRTVNKVLEFVISKDSSFVAFEFGFETII